MRGTRLLFPVCAGESLLILMAFLGFCHQQFCMLFRRDYLGGNGSRGSDCLGRCWNATCEASGRRKRLQTGKANGLRSGNCVPEPILQSSGRRVPVVQHGRYVTFHLAEVVVSRALFADIVVRIDHQRRGPGAREGPIRPSLLKDYGQIGLSPSASAPT